MDNSNIPEMNEIIDFNNESTSPSRLIKMFRTAEQMRADENASETPVSVKMDVDLYPPYFSGEIPSATEYEVVTTDGKYTVDKNAMVRYLKAYRVVYIGQTAYQFNGAYYMRVDTDYIARLIYNALDEYHNPPFLSRSNVQDIIAKLKATSTVFDVEPPEDWNPQGLYDDELIPFQNGLYNIKHDVLLPFVPWKFITHNLQATYNPRIVNHPVEQVYKKIIPDKATREFFFQMVGYSVFTREMSPPAIFVIYGPGNTGKTALQHALTSLVGPDHVSTLDIAQLSGGYTTAELEDKLVNVCGETGSGQSRDTSKVDGELLKRLSDGQTITVRQIYGRPYQLRNSSKLWFITNTLPDFGDTSSGLYRRLYIIPCRNHQRWEDQIYDKLSEPDAISWLVNKALEGYRRFIRNGFKFDVSTQMQSELKFYKKQEGLMDFFEEYLGSNEVSQVPDLLDGVVAQDMYESYRNYCTNGGGKALSIRKFTEKVRNEFAMETAKERRYSDEGKPTHRLVFKKPVTY